VELSQSRFIHVTIDIDGEGFTLTNRRDTGKAKSAKGSLDGFTLRVKDLWLEKYVDYDAGHGTLPGFDGRSDPIGPEPRPGGGCRGVS